VKSQPAKTGRFSLSPSPAGGGTSSHVRARSVYTDDRPDGVNDKADALETAIDNARQALLATQHPDGYWSFELEADCTIPAEYIIMMHFVNEIDTGLQAKIARYIRDHQLADNGWSLYPGGCLDISCSVKAYFALKLAGDQPDAPHMTRARDAILKRGGAARSNVFTRITLALFRQVPWRATPFIPAEIMLLPRWFPFHLSKVSYWSRTVIVPLFILCSIKPVAKNPTGTDIRELFTVDPWKERHYFPCHSALNRIFLWLDRGARLLEPLIPHKLRARAINAAEDWFLERLNGDGGLGAIFPAMVNAYEALACLGYPPQHRYRKIAKKALEDLLVIHNDRAYCQPCNSPVWDTGLTCLTLQEINRPQAKTATTRALDWLAKMQFTGEPGDWRESRPHLKGGGWPFQLKNSHYPDLDDTAVVAWAMHCADRHAYRHRIQRAAKWLCGMQSNNAGFASFDADNTCYYLNAIPFADHGALLDPPTADVSARCVALLGRLVSDDDDCFRAILDRSIEYLRTEQEADGSWFGRWGTNYIYGTWSVLSAFEQAGMAPRDPCIRRAVAWLTRMQQEDGGWGEHNDSYLDRTLAGGGHTSTAFQTAWAMLALMAAGEADSVSVHNGAQFLLRKQNSNGVWQDDCFTAPGFPRVFYLKYHGYDYYFPL